MQDIANAAKYDAPSRSRHNRSYSNCLGISRGFLGLLSQVGYFRGFIPVAAMVCLILYLVERD